VVLPSSAYRYCHFVMDPISAGALLAPLFVLMDLCALRYWKPSTWSKSDLLVLVPSLIAGIGLGYVTLRLLDARAVAIVMAVIILVFTGLWLRSGSLPDYGFVAEGRSPLVRDRRQKLSRPVSAPGSPQWSLTQVDRRWRCICYRWG
jgi:uncharacterized membrane protein YfcA